MIKMVAAIAAMAFALPANASDENGDRFCLAQNIYFESANQSFAGRVAVANVVLNRVEDDQFPSTVCDVVYQAEMKENWKGNLLPVLHRCQFSWYCDGKSDLPTDSTTWMESFRIAGMVLAFEYQDITEGALWYHSDSVEPYWSKQLSLVTTIDNHLFYN
jgi:spore germination cell wall hydrolase CwlJ-like protein